ncbi:MAG: lycopene cyclase domain-containing protein [Flavobacteriaceae bacterium]|jgi:lycopene cyclase domain-containing protein|nr:lycopene cyclase domain-containing protein [Flavobacteriaceae bacterium]
MNALYLLLNLGSISVPFLYSFHPRLQLHKRFLWIFVSILLTMAIFIPWDVIFTLHDIWGFNDTYFLRIKFLSLPLEEWLFFICIPFACVFTHYALLLYFPNLKLNKTSTKWISSGLMTLLFVLAAVNYDKWYTVINFSLAIPLTYLVYRYNPKLLQHFLLTFLVMLIPFFIVNGILTGSFIDNQVVWYNNAENLGIRMGTIPVEDSIYAYTLILCNLFLTELFVKKYHKTNEY